MAAPALISARWPWWQTRTAASLRYWRQSASRRPIRRCSATSGSNRRIRGSWHSNRRCISAPISSRSPNGSFASSRPAPTSPTRRNCPTAICAKASASTRSDQSGFDPGCHCEERERRSNLDRGSTIGARLLRFARNDDWWLPPALPAQEVDEGRGEDAFFPVPIREGGFDIGVIVGDD